MTLSVLHRLAGDDLECPGEMAHPWVPRNEIEHQRAAQGVAVRPRMLGVFSRFAGDEVWGQVSFAQ
ncbi:hypothetical protein FOH10_22660 [Nocardia otitidiscaviarum]|uniref:Uncharacterized protein n=1 Tax=Nocardia otitidiscaviarum TaxID=1823 RepID=A0A516NQE4_9NOCA|nr:hypothetical protein [Nocardia otitidiscaviarum]MCP9620226.1 hypothetical protein [Nocardia otitidiscaviarum]QDP81103.1 hypothetical protein FOH10_22660 [Nocardia otitidiscaviarum]